MVFQYKSHPHSLSDISSSRRKRDANSRSAADRARANNNNNCTPAYIFRLVPTVFLFPLYPSQDKRSRISCLNQNKNRFHHTHPRRKYRARKKIIWLIYWWTHRCNGERVCFSNCSLPERAGIVLFTIFHALRASLCCSPVSLHPAAPQANQSISLQSHGNRNTHRLT